MMRKFKVTASSNSSALKVTPYVINKGQSGEYYGLKNTEDNQVLTSAPNNWKSKKGAIAWAKKKGYEVVESACGKKSVKAAHYKAKTGGWNYDNPETNKFLFLYKHRWYTGYKTFDECLADVINTVGIDNIISEGVEISKENSAGYSIERWDSSEVYEAANDVSIAHNKKSVKASSDRWVTTDCQVPNMKEHPIMDMYSKNYGSYSVRVVPEYNDRIDVLSWTVYLIETNEKPRRLESFETPYDAKDFADYEVYDMYVKPVNSSKSVKKFGIKASKSAKRRKAIKASFDENGFAVTGYLGSNRSGAYADRYFGPDEWSEVESYAHELLMQGLYVNIIYFKTGDQINIDPDVYAENFDGEFIVTNEIADFRDKVWKSMGIGASTKRRNGSKVTAAWYEGGDIVMYFNGEKIYEGQPGADMYDAILPLCQDDETRLKFQEWCNQFGDPLFDDEYGDASETAYTFCELIYYDFVDDENNYEDGNGILDFEIFPATEEVTGTKSVKCASENISAAEYNQMLADMTLGILHDDGYEGIGCAVTDEALSFYDGTEDDVVYIQPTDEITPILGDEDADAEELAAAVKSVAGKAVEATTYEDLEPINGEDEDYGYGFDSNGEAISESTVDELYRIAEREVLPTTELAKVDEYATIMEDTFEYYASSTYVGVTYTISATFDTDDIDVVSYALPDAFHYDFRGGKEVGELEFYIYVKGNEIDKVELIWNSSNIDPDNYDMEAIEEYVKGIAKPAAEAIYNAITNI